MDSEYLKTFVTLAKGKNYTQAADLLYISQSSLTKRIQKIEKQLGVNLFNRNTKSVELSKYGYIYLEYAEKILQLEQECLKKIDQAVVHENSLIIGSIPSIGQYGISKEITNFIKDTGAEIKIITEPSGKLEKLLHSNQCDFAFIREVKDKKYSKQIPYAEDQMVAVLPKNHHLANLKEISISQLEKEFFLLEPKGSRPYNLCVNLCKNYGFVPNVIYTDRQIENIVDLVADGMGISLLMSKLVPKETSRIVSIPIKPTVSTSISLCYMTDANLTDLKRKFIAYIKNR
ncbi:LysR family transcriptional regulator [Oenococcus sp. UCMA 16435]|nr:LysR family transcriptional regulator [Oenococcus sp. UCMA 16435]MDI4584546.1 LysR family transcriptional regulator [Oenococcus sp. UCMA 14587]